MEALFVYLLKSSALVAVFYLSYFFLLRKETFFKSNRCFLLAGPVTSVVLPWITFKKVIWVEPTRSLMDWKAAPTAVYNAPVVESFEMDWVLILGVVYFVGISGFALKFFRDFLALQKALKGKTIYRQADLRFVDTNENVSPFSYFNYIVFNSSLYSAAELENILEHEKVHSNQNHTRDVLFARLFCIAFWFNPFVWFYKKAILQNLEFIADREAAKKIKDIRSYQITLLKVTAHENCVDITNHFYQSLIKKRIVMLNKNQSKKWNSWKYFIIVPALAAFFFYFQVNVIAKEKLQVTTSEKAIAAFPFQDGTTVICNKNTTDAELNNESARVKKEHDVTLKFSKIKRNKNGEIIAVKAEFKDKNGKKGATQINSAEPIRPIIFFMNGNEVGFGNMQTSTVAQLVGNSNSSDSQFVGFDKKNAPEPPASPAHPEMPIPPAPPAVPNFSSRLPESPKFPTAPMVPNGLPNKNNEKEWAAFDKKMAEFDKKMEAMQPEIDAFEKEMEAFELDMEPFNAEMEKFEKKMEVFEKEMENYMKKYEKSLQSEE